MKKFEYYSFFAVDPTEVDNTLDELGKDGWEAYAVVMMKDGAYHVFLKRETSNVTVAVK